MQKAREQILRAHCAQTGGSHYAHFMRAVLQHDRPVLKKTPLSHTKLFCSGNEPALLERGKKIELKRATNFIQRSTSVHARTL